MQNPDFTEIVTLICKEDSRFDRKAYDFVRLGLDHTVKELRKKNAARADKSRHVTGPELLEGLRVYALDQFVAGDLDPILDLLRAAHQAELLQAQQGE